MKNKLVILLFTLLITTIIKAQSYEFLNQILTISDKTTYVKDKFEILHNDIVDSYLNESFIKSNWAPLPYKNIPPINLFLDNFDLINARKIARENNISNNTIDFGKLNNSIVKFNELNNYLVLTKPIFNESKDWAISFLYPVFFDRCWNFKRIEYLQKDKWKMDSFS